MRNTTLYQVLEAFTADASGQLAAETARGVEVPFEVVETESRPPGRVPLYCYRPLTGAFINERLGKLSGLPTYAPAARALAEADGVANYLRQHGGARVPGEPRERADAVLKVFLSLVFADRSEFGFDATRFEKTYGELERMLYDGRCTTMVIAPLLGIALDPETSELALDDGLSLVAGDEFQDAPADAVWADGDEPNVLAVLSVTQERAVRAPVSTARTRFRKILTALRLFERGGYALGPIGWTRTDTGPWRPVAIGGSGRPRFVTTIHAEQEDEFRGFCNLIARRSPAGGELAWALSRFGMGCERFAPFESLTDYLLALRALLEPEGPASGRLAGRLAAICARPEDRAQLAERTAHAISLERAVVAGLAPAEPGVDGLVDELAADLRALLRDALCGHLEPDLVKLADDLLTEKTPARA